MKFSSTRDAKIKESFSSAIVKDRSIDGGLFLPEKLPKLSKTDISKLRSMSFTEISAFIFKSFADEFEYSELLDIFEKAFSNFEENVVSTVLVDEGLSFCEAFNHECESIKTLQNAVLPYLIEKAKDKLGIENKTLIIAFAEKDCEKVISKDDCDSIYTLSICPTDTNCVQKSLLRDSRNDRNGFVEINGSQKNIKNEIIESFTNERIESALRNHGFSSYYASDTSLIGIFIRLSRIVSTYCDLLNGEQLSENETFNVALNSEDVVETIACLYAKKIGIPVNTIICADDSRKIAVKFWNEGVLNLEETDESYAIDFAAIEMLLFELFDGDCQKTERAMNELHTNHATRVDKKLFASSSVLAGYATNDEVCEIIESVADKWDYVCSPSTARATSVYDDYSCEVDDERVVAIIADESPFLEAVNTLYAITKRRESDYLKAINSLTFATGIETPMKYKSINNNHMTKDEFESKTDVCESITEFVETLKGE